MKRLSYLAVVVCMAAGAPAWAQDTTGSSSDGASAGASAGTSSGAPTSSGDDGNANIPDPLPDAPDIGNDDTTATAHAVHRYTKHDYPVELIKRPLTLAEGQAEASLDNPFVAHGGDAPTITHVLRLRYGVTRDLEVGVTYGIGFERLKRQSSQSTFEVGKGFSADVAYTILPGWLAAQLSLPFYADPDFFGMGLNLSVPFRVAFSDKWAVIGGQDLLQVKLVKMPVDPSDPEASVAIVDATKQSVAPPSGNLNLKFGGLYQATPHLAATLMMFIGWPNFKTTDQPIGLFAGGVWSPNKTLDVGARLGFHRLDDPGETFTLSVFAAYRI